MLAKGLANATQKTYLSGQQRYLSFCESGDRTPAPVSEETYYVLRGVKREEALKGGSGRERLPMTPPILSLMKGVWKKESRQQDTIMLWAAVCLGFFGFLRSGEMTVPSDTGYNPAVHLSRCDIAVNDVMKPTVIRVTLKQSKTDLFKKGVYLFLGRTATDLCPVTAMLSYLVVRGTQRGPLFIFRDGR